MLIQASCSYCVPSKLAVPPAFKYPGEQQYRADMETCQVVGNKPTTGIGKAFFYFYNSTRQLHFNLNHDLSSTITGVQLVYGGNVGFMSA